MGGLPRQRARSTAQVHSRLFADTVADVREWSRGDRLALLAVGVAVLLATLTRGETRALVVYVAVLLAFVLLSLFAPE
jgi:hypothetical protein